MKNKLLLFYKLFKLMIIKLNFLNKILQLIILISINIYQILYSYTILQKLNKESIINK